MSAPATDVTSPGTPANVGAVDDELAKRLRRNALMLDRWRASRDSCIREAREAGASYREIAAEVGLSHVGVMKIINGYEDAIEVAHITPVSEGGSDDDPDNLEVFTADEHKQLEEDS